MSLGMFLFGNAYSVLVKLTLIVLSFFLPKVLHCNDVFGSNFFCNRLCIKVGRGQGDGDIGTRTWGTWDLGTRDEELEDIKYGTRGRVGRGRGDVKYRDAGDTGCE